MATVLYALPVLLFIVFAGAMTFKLLLLPASLIIFLLNRVYPMSEERGEGLANSLAAGLLAAGVFALQMFRPS